MSLNKFDNCSCKDGACTQNGLLHWQILQEDYDKLPDEYKNCGIVFFVKQTKDSPTGVIIRNNVVYSGGGESEFKEVDGKEYQVIINDGEGQVRSSEFIAKKVDFSYMDTFSPYEDGECLLDIELSLSPTNHQNKIKSIKIIDETENEEKEYIIGEDLIQILQQGFQDGIGISIGTVKQGKDIATEDENKKNDSYYVVNSSNKLLYEIEAGSGNQPYLNFKPYINYANKIIKIKQILDKTHSYSLSVSYETNLDTSNTSYTGILYKINGQITTYFIPTVSGAATDDSEGTYTETKTFSFDQRLVTASNAMGVPNKAEELLFTNSPYFGSMDDNAGYLSIKDSGRIKAQDKGQIKVQNSADASFSGNSIVSLGENVRFTMHDNAKMDITGGEGRESDGPQVYIHGNSKIYIDDGFSKKYYGKVQVKVYWEKTVYKSSEEYNNYTDGSFDGENPDEELVEEIKGNATAFIGLTSPYFSTSYGWGEERIRTFLEGKNGELYSKRIVIEEYFSYIKLVLQEIWEVPFNDYLYIGREGDQFFNGKVITPTGAAPHFQLSDSPFIYFKESPYFTVQGKSYFVLQGSPNVVFGDSSYFHAQGSAKAIFEENSILSVKDEFKGNFQGRTSCNIGGSSMDSSGSSGYGSGGCVHINVFDGTQIHIGTQSDMSIWKPRDSSDIQALSPLVHLLGPVTFKMEGNSNVELRDQGNLKMSGGAYFQMLGEKDINQYGEISSPSPYVSMTGPSKIIMQSNGSRGPALMLTPDQMVLTTCGGLEKYGATVYGNFTNPDTSYISLLNTFRAVKERIKKGDIDSSIYSYLNSIINDGTITRRIVTLYSYYTNFRGNKVAPSYVKDWNAFINKTARYPKGELSQRVYILKDEETSTEVFDYLPDLNTVFIREGSEDEKKILSQKLENYFDIVDYITSTTFCESFCKEYSLNQQEIFPKIESTYYITNINKVVEWCEEIKGSSSEKNKYFYFLNGTIPYKRIDSVSNDSSISFFKEDSIDAFITRSGKYPDIVYKPTSYIGDLNESGILPFGMFMLQNDARILVGSTGSSQWVQMGGNSGDSLHVYIQNNSFIQHSGNSHEEVHDASTIIMRGKINSNRNFMNRKHPWEDYYEGAEEFRRPVMPRDNGPLNSMYDESVFYMRGVWNLEKEGFKQETVTLTLNDENDGEIINGSEAPTIDELAEKSQTFKNWQKQQGKYYDKKVSDDYPSPEGQTKNEIEYEVGSTTLTIKNYIYTTCPPDWTAEIPRKPDSPLLELSDNAEVRFSGNIKIQADEKQITFTKQIDDPEASLAEDNNSVTFTFDELKQLKSLLSSATPQP